MNKEVPVSLVFGCGREGLNWAEKQTAIGNRWVRGLDHKNIDPSSANFVKGNILRSPFNDQSANQIYADLIFNSVNVNDITLSDIRNDPNILMDKSFPESVRAWCAGKTEPQIRGNTDELRWLLKADTLREMMRVLKTNGEIFIIDRPFIVEWIKNKACNILEISPEKIKIEDLGITPEDHDRSLSLREILKEGEPLAKIVINKLY